MADVKYFRNHVFKRRPTTADGDFLDYPDTEDPKTSDIVARDLLLFDFDIDWDALKTKHENKLDEAGDKGPGGWEIRIDGYSSKTFMGKEANEKDKTAVEHNDYLSNMREQEVENYLRKKIPNKQITYVPNWHGFAEHKSKGESPSERSVRVHIQRPGLPPPLPKALPSPPPPKVTDVLDHTWNIRQLGAVSAGWKGAAGDLLFFEIWAKNEHYSAIYTYTGVGASVGTPGSVTFKGPWQKEDFETMHQKGNAKSSQPVAFGSFEGAARFTSAGGGKATINLLKFGSLPPGIVTFPTDPLEIDTGTTWGLGVSASIGTLTWSPRIPFPRSTA